MDFPKPNYEKSALFKILSSLKTKHCLLQLLIGGATIATLRQIAYRQLVASGQHAFGYKMTFYDDDDHGDDD